MGSLKRQAEVLGTECIGMDKSEDVEFVQYLVSPLGVLKIIADPFAIVSLEFVKQKGHERSNVITRSAVIQLREYFKGVRRQFHVPVLPDGTSFQESVWNALREIPFGEVESYSGIARKIGCPCGSRAVGNANGANPIPLLIPCHRVVRSGGMLGGYSSGLWRKQWLLRHEGSLK